MRKQLRVTLPLLLLAVFLIRLFAADKRAVEKYYSNTIYPVISRILKYVYGWIPFSLGDILYGLLAGWMLFKIIQFSIRLIKKKYTWQLFLQSCVKLLVGLLVLYVLFNGLWGLNYNRLGIADQIGIKLSKYSKDDLVTVDSVLLEKTNAAKAALINQPVLRNTGSIFRQSVIAYQNLADKYSFCHYDPSSIKSSAWGWLGNYLGFTGYYNPFTGEAQVNTSVPSFLQPFISCHEIAHQLGYAKENEANFVGYLAATAASDMAFHYSVYLDLFLYTQRNLYSVDSMAAKSFSKKLLPSVRDDLAEWKKFNEQHQSPLEPVFTWMYGKYLTNNEQPAGVLSYDEVTGFLIAYYKKFGKL